MLKESKIVEMLNFNFNYEIVYWNIVLLVIVDYKFLSDAW